MKWPAIVRKAHQVAKESRKRSYSPYSKFKVGAALVTAKGKIIGGCNIENASYGGTVCAERVAILKAASEGDVKFQGIVVVTDAEKPAYPCALCLQTMAEFFAPDARIWVGNLRGIRAEYRFVELLPQPFGPQQLADAR